MIVAKGRLAPGVTVGAALRELQLRHARAPKEDSNDKAAPPGLETFLVPVLRSDVHGHPVEMQEAILCVAN